MECAKKRQKDNTQVKWSEKDDKCIPQKQVQNTIECKKRYYMKHVVIL